MKRTIAWHPILLVAAGILVSAGCGSSDPFDYVQVSGKVTYEDGTRIPAETAVRTFYPQSGELDAKTHPKTGMAAVRKKDGTIAEVSSHKAGDGLVPGEHKVTLTDLNGAPLPENLVPPEYADPETTPLQIDTADTPFHLKVRKP